jgi:hypothetical protein
MRLVIRIVRRQGCQPLRDRGGFGISSLAVERYSEKMQRTDIAITKCERTLQRRLAVAKSTRTQQDTAQQGMRSRVVGFELNSLLKRQDRLIEALRPGETVTEIDVEAGDIGIERDRGAKICFSFYQRTLMDLHDAAPVALKRVVGLRYYLRSGRYHGLGRWLNLRAPSRSRFGRCRGGYGSILSHAKQFPTG